MCWPGLKRVTLRRPQTPQGCKDSSLSLCLLPKILQGKETATVLNKLAMNAGRQFNSQKSSEMPRFSCLIEEVWAVNAVFFVEIQCAIHKQRILNWVLHSLLIFGDILTSWGCQDMWFAHVRIFLVRFFKVFYIWATEMEKIIISCNHVYIWNKSCVNS